MNCSRMTIFIWSSLAGSVQNVLPARWVLAGSGDGFGDGKGVGLGD